MSAPPRADIAAEYRARGWRPIPIPPRSKNPNRSGWQHERYENGTIAAAFAGAGNIGVLLGKPSAGLADVDLDCPEARIVGVRLLPPTGAVFGRAGNPRSHRLYYAPEATTERFKDAAGATLIELRSTGGQTVFPPSIHPSGEPIAWVADGEAAAIAAGTLRQAVARTAAAALFARHWPAAGSRHEAALALASALLRAGWSDAEAAAFITATAEGAGDEESRSRARECVPSTRARLAAGEPATGIPSLAETFGAAVIDRALRWLSVAQSRSASAHVSAEWPARRPLPSAPSVPTLPAEMVPAPLRDWLTDLAGRACVPLECLAAPALVAVAGAVGRSIGIRPWAFSDFTAIPNLWGGIVAGPGALKSHAIQEAVRPLAALEAEERRRTQAQAAQDEARLEGLKARRDGIKQAIALAAKRTPTAAPSAELAEQLAHVLEAVTAAGTTARRYITSDATVEKLGALLHDNPRGLLLHRDELAGWLATFERQGREGDRAFMLEAWNGDGSFTIDRIGRGTVHVPALCLSVLGGVQPARLQSYVREAIDSGGSDGLIARLQVLVYPDGLPAWAAPASWPKHNTRRAAEDLFGTLDRLTPAALGAEHDGPESSVPFLRFDADAQQLASRWRDALENRLRSRDLARTPAFEAHVSKYRSLFPSLALLFHVLAVAAGQMPSPVCLDCAALAADWCAFLEEHARKVYAAELRPEYAAAAALAARLEAGDVPDGTTARDIARNGWRDLGSAERVDAGLRLLEPAGWARVESVETGGRPSRIVRVHPDLRGRNGG